MRRGGLVGLILEAKWHSDKDKLCTMIGVVGTSFARARALLFHAWD